MVALVEIYLRLNFCLDQLLVAHLKYDNGFRVVKLDNLSGLESEHYQILNRLEVFFDEVNSGSALMTADHSLVQLKYDGHSELTEAEFDAISTSIEAVSEDLAFCLRVERN